MDNLLIKCRDSLESINKYTDAAKEQVKKLVMDDGKVSKQLMAKEQHAAHSLAWIATYKATLTELLNWAERLESENKLLETEKHIVQQNSVFLFHKLIKLLGDRLIIIND